MSLFDGNTLMQLQKLLRDPDEEVDSDGEDCGPPRRGGVDQLGPGDIGPKKQSKKSAKLDAETAARRERYAPIKKTEEKRPATMEEWEEMQEKENNEIIETRKRPKYTVLYKQAVKTEDIYLQMGGKTDSTASCEDMVLNIELPDETTNFEGWDLVLLRDKLELRTPTYCLNLPLSHNCDPDKGKAHWDSDSKILKLTLRLVREFDYVNF